MTDPPALEAPTITCWRDVGSAFRRREFRLPVMLALVAVGEACLLCLVVALLVTTALFAWAIEPALTAAFGRVPGPFLVQLAVGSLVGYPLLRFNVRLMYRAANRWMGPRSERKGSNDV